MKKLFLLLSITILSLLPLSAQQNYGIKHSNPMPNLIRVVVANAELLNVNKSQMQEIKAWRKANKTTMKIMVQDVVREERALKESALSTGKNLQKMADSIIKNRANIISMKIACRANLQRILTPKQFEQLLNIYKSVL